MPTIHRTLGISFNIEDIYSIIIDVASYPEFLPFCTKTVILEQSKNHLVADTHIQYKMLSGVWQSDVKMEHPHKVEIKQTSSILKALDSVWELKPTSENHTHIDFYVHFQTHFSLLDKMAGSVVEGIADEIVQAFMNRAQHLYG
jgi:coenzyme Q-binding protein COQ10